MKYFALKHFQKIDNELLELTEFIKEYLNIKVKLLENENKISKLDIRNKQVDKQKENIEYLIDIWEPDTNGKKIDSYNKAINGLVNLDYIFVNKEE